MTETVVHVTTLEQWKSVLDVWFEQGYRWVISNGYAEEHFYNGSRQLGLNVHGTNEISYFSNNDYGDNLIEYADFMAQQEKTMLKKFTEEQYRKIVKIAEGYRINSAFGIIGDTKQNSIGAEFYETELVNEIDFYENSKEMMAIVNPLTREWAHAKFVDKEKKYYWTNKKGNDIGIYEDNGLVFLKERHWAPLTESEIREWGYNPDMFNRRIL